MSNAADRANKMRSETVTGFKYMEVICYIDWNGPKKVWEESNGKPRVQASHLRNFGVKGNREEGL